MQFLSTILALAGIAAALPTASDSYESTSAACTNFVTSSMCLPVYQPYVSTVSYNAVQTVTVTEYQPATTTTEVKSYYTVTSYCKFGKRS